MQNVVVDRHRRAGIEEGSQRHAQGAQARQRPGRPAQVRGREQRHRRAAEEQVIAELDALLDQGWRGPVFFVDDNIIGNANHLQQVVLNLMTNAAEAMPQGGRLKMIVDSLPQFIWTCLPDGRRDYVSPQWPEYTGLPTEAALGFGWLAAVAGLAFALAGPALVPLLAGWRWTTPWSGSRAWKT